VRIALPKETVESRSASGSRRVGGRALPWLLALLGVTAAIAVVFWQPLERYRHQSRARRLLSQHDNDAALRELRIALSNNLEDTETLFLLARTHRRLGNLHEMSLILERVAALGGDAGRIQRERRLALAQIGQIRETEPYLAEMLVNAGPDGPDICQAFVQGYFANLQTEAAEKLLDVWQQSYPKDPQPVFMRAFMWQGMGHPDESIELYRQALTSAPERTAMRRRLAEALLETSALDEAEAELSICLEQAPEDAEIHYLLARCAFARGDAQLAIQRLGETLELAPDHLDARRLKGQLDLAQGNSEAARRELELVVSRRGYDVLAREALGRALRNLGQDKEAKAQLEFVARAQESIGRLNRLMREALAKPEDAELRYQIGKILFEYGPPEDAAKWMRAALQRKPDHQEAHRALARLFEQQGDATNAALHRQAVSPDASNP
jgi:tetratricopeptide (TPR) repeat protein